MPDLRMKVRRLEAEVAHLRGVLAEHGLEAAPADAISALGLTEAESSLLTILREAHPQSMSQYDLDAAIPALRARTRGDPDFRVLTSLRTLIFRIREKLGEDVIETTRGSGYRLGDATAAMLGKRIAA